MKMVAILVMVVGGIGMLVGLSKEKAGATWGRPFAIVCIILALIGAALFTQQNMSGGGGSSGIVEKEKKFQEASGEYLGQFLAEKYSGSKALIMIEPSLSSTPKENMQVEGLKKGFGSAITVVDVVRPEIPADALSGMNMGGEMPEGAEGEMLPPMEYWFTGAQLKKLLSNYSDYDMLITTIGLPERGLNEIQNVFKQKKVVIANGSIYKLKRAIQSGAIKAAIAYNPSADYDKGPEKDVKATFDIRYVLVTPETLGSAPSGVFGN